MGLEATTLVVAVEHCAEDIVVDDHMVDDMAGSGVVADSNVAEVGEYRAVVGIAEVELGVFPVVLHIVV